MPFLDDLNHASDEFYEQKRRAAEEQALQQKAQAQAKEQEEREAQEALFQSLVSRYSEAMLRAAERGENSAWLKSESSPSKYAKWQVVLDRVVNHFEALGVEIRIEKKEEYVSHELARRNWDLVARWGRTPFVRADAQEAQHKAEQAEAERALQEQQKQIQREEADAARRAQEAQEAHEELLRRQAAIAQLHQEEEEQYEKGLRDAQEEAQLEVRLRTLQYRQQNRLCLVCGRRFGWFESKSPFNTHGVEGLAHHHCVQEDLEFVDDNAEFVPPEQL